MTDSALTPTDKADFFNELSTLCRDVNGAQPANFFKRLTALAAAWTRSDRACLVLEDALQRRLVRGSDTVHTLQDDDAASRWLFEHDAALVVPDLDNRDVELALVFPDDGCGAFLGVPVTTDGAVRGALSVRNAASRLYSQGEVEAMTLLASFVSLAVTQFELGRRLDEHHRTMVRFALTDPLTNLASQQHFDHMLRREFRRAQAEVFPLSLLRLSIDAFQPHDNRIGPQRDRDALVTVARVLDKALYRSTDLVARLEKGRFAILLPDTDHLGAAAIAERLVGEVAALDLPHPAGVGRKLSLSVGVASHEPLNPQHFLHNPEELVRMADEGLERAQTVGGNQVVAKA